MSANRHPIDELSDVRAEMKWLKAREDELRDLILSNGCEMTGDQFYASITTTQQNKLDLDAVRAVLGPEQVKAMSKPVRIRMIRLSERELLEAE